MQDPAGSSPLAEGVTKAGSVLRLGAKPFMPADLGQTSSFPRKRPAPRKRMGEEGLPSLLGKWEEEN